MAGHGVAIATRGIIFKPKGKFIKCHALPIHIGLEPICPKINLKIDNPIKISLKVCKSED